MEAKISYVSKIELVLCELIEAINDTPEVFPLAREKLLSISNSRNQIIPHYILEANRERQQREEELDQRYKELLTKWHKLNRDYYDPGKANQHDRLLTELEVVQQEMTEILQEL